jgi:anti-repressor protein
MNGRKRLAKKRLKQVKNDYGFTQDIDFIALKKKYTDSKGVSRINSRGYHATLNMAKELCMMERNEKGSTLIVSVEVCRLL